MQGPQGVPLDPAQQVAHPQDPQPEVSSFQWLVDLFKSIIHCLCCCFSQDDKPSLDGRVVTTTVEETDGVAPTQQSTALVQEPDDDAPTPITTGALIPVSQRQATISPGSSFDELKKFCPTIGEWLQADGTVNMTINYAMGSKGKLDWESAIYEGAPESTCRDICQGLIDDAQSHLNQRNFKYCIKVTISRKNNPKEFATFAWQNVKRQGRALLSGTEPALLTHKST